MRVLHAVEDMKIGGMERVIASIANRLDPARYAVHVLCLARGGALADELVRHGVPVTILGLDNYHRPGQILLLYRWLRKHPCHILHTHGYFAGVFARIAGLIARTPRIVSHVHSTYIDYRKKHLCMEKILSLWTDRVICVSRAVQQWVVEDEGIDIRKTIVIYNGPDLNFADRSDESVAATQRRTMGIPGHDTVFTIVASLTSNKGHQILLESFRRVLASHPDSTLMIVGDGPLRTELEARARELSVDRKVIFVGLRTDVDALLRISDVCLLPSQFREGLGLALIEAMAAGLPVIGTSIGGIPEAIADGDNGFLVPPARAAMLAGVMMRIAKDRNLGIRMGRRSRQIYEDRFSPSKMIRRIETLYAGLLENEKHAVPS